MTCEQAITLVAIIPLSTLGLIFIIDILRNRK